MVRSKASKAQSKRLCNEKAQKHTNLLKNSLKSLPDKKHKATTKKTNKNNQEIPPLPTLSNTEDEIEIIQCSLVISDSDDEIQIDHCEEQNVSQLIFFHPKAGANI